jgi:hypothetical protein
MTEKNMIPIILKQRGWSRYKLWQSLGGTLSDRTLVYSNLARAGAENAPIPPGTQWQTIKRFASALEVEVTELERAIS